MIVTEAQANAEQLNLEGLVETCGASPTRSAATALAFFTALGTRSDTRLRGAFGGLALTQIWVLAYGWQVLPRDQAFARGEAP